MSNRQADCLQSYPEVLFSRGSGTDAHPVCILTLPLRWAKPCLAAILHLLHYSFEALSILVPVFIHEAKNDLIDANIIHYGKSQLLQLLGEAQRLIAAGVDNTGKAEWHLLKA